MNTLRALTITFFLSVFLSGCGGGAVAPPSSNPGTTTAGAEHAHPTEGPHQGSLIELGNEEYHAEMVHDEKAGTLTIYLLDAAVKQAVPISEAEIFVNLKVKGAATQLPLKADPLPGEAAGSSSRFVARGSAEALEALDAEDSEPRLQVTIQGQSYLGRLEHHHDHGAEMLAPPPGAPQSRPE